MKLNKTLTFFIFSLFIQGCATDSTRLADYREASADEDIVLLERKDRKRFIKIRKVSVENYESALSTADKMNEALVGQFRFIPMAFMGREAEAEKCRNRFKPRKEKLDGGHFIITFADDRFAICICQVNEPVFKRASAWLINREHNQLMALDYFFADYPDNSVIRNEIKTHFPDYLPLPLSFTESKDLN